ncbi:MAG: hypothetical protein ABEJ98_00395 [Candidatus Nanohaloarchaea archaeon]
MSYYDNVKDNVKNNGSDSDSPKKKSSNQFESLKEAAEETSNEPDDEKGDDTPIEVLEEDGLSREAPGSGQSSAQRSQNSQQSGADASSPDKGNPLTEDSDSSTGSETDLSGIEERLDRIIEQNERMIRILESFGS